MLTAWRNSHKYRSLPLIPVEEFLELQPEHRETNEHDLMIARINHEHAEREKLEQARQELLKRKQVLIALNKKRREDLASLDQDLEKFIDVFATRSPCCFWDAANWFLSRRPSRFRKFLRRNTRHALFS